MKNYFRFFGIVALFVAIGFLTVSCSTEDNDEVGNLKGAWVSDNIVVTISGNNGTFTQINLTNTGWAIARERGWVAPGDEKFRNIKKTKDPLQWTAQSLLYDPNTYYSKGWRNCRIYISEDGKTFKVVCVGDTDPYINYTKK